MKNTNFFYHMLIVLGLCCFMFCGGNNNNETGNNTKSGDSTVADSTHVGDLRDPATAYPQPPVTGTTVDSSRSKDSLKR